MSLEQYHLISLLRKQSRTRPDEIALEGYDSVESWQHVSWKKFDTITNKLAQWFIQSDINIQDKCAIMAQNAPQWTCADVGILKARAVVVPIYPTNTLEQAEFIINDAEAKILFVDNEEAYQQACELRKLCPSLLRIVVFDATTPLVDIKDAHFDNILIETQSPAVAAVDIELKVRLTGSNLDDLLTLIYTSGTTGDPKGVMLDYRNIASTVKQHDTKLSVSAGDVSLAFLPLSHIFERGWSFYCLCRGVKNVYLTDTSKIKEAMTKVKPQTMCAVPRFLEKVYCAIQDKVSNAPTAKQKLFHWATTVGERQFEVEQGRRKSTLILSVQWKLASKLVLSPLKSLLGGRFRFIPCGGAALDVNIERFFHAIGIPVLCGYGMTETTATVTCNTPEQRTPGSNGQTLPDTEIKIGANNEILVRGDGVMRGYYRRPQETADTFENGWLKTGDAGHIDEKGNLFITDRIKELMKTSNGKYIAPQRVEGKVGCCPYIEQVAVIADAKNYVTALIVPAYETLEVWAKEQGLKYSSHLELLRHSKVIAHFEQRVNDMQQGLANFEKVKKFTLLPDAFSMEAGLITPTLKLKRKMIYHKYANEISAMYQR
ncbi:long-chain fatty acid--CoA ligase [Parashewanella spongiae]|uniref:Long-chain fatty acid--CoA ligase n=1 Tax=Parashewanella spongiae TaxID=342950 RepID=A0A3A6U8K3_9GAMM|nr:long-chain fatty acid--CoA ligase [Parashewanella spongiae]MCL1078503.1 long-chain fatty acid--CoA ligase [Parashewanella spongiae]RJY14704.1 long-chain fatty acid--CoA ligase [Parashewanella spongiae]